MCEAQEHQLMTTSHDLISKRGDKDLTIYTYSNQLGSRSLDKAVQSLSNSVNKLMSQQPL
jgi:hypothetical protein